MSWPCCGKIWLVCMVEAINVIAEKLSGPMIGVQRSREVVDISSGVFDGAVSTVSFGVGHDAKMNLVQLC